MKLSHVFDIDPLLRNGIQAAHDLVFHFEEWFIFMAVEQGLEAYIGGESGGAIVEEFYYGHSEVVQSEVEEEVLLVCSFHYFKSS